MQERRRGPDHHWNGPRLPTSPASTNKLDDIGDPARGEKVPRCLTCGVPDLPANRLMEFALFYAGRNAGWYRLCERCWLHANPPLPVDPLQVDEAAA